MTIATFFQGLFSLLITAFAAYVLYQQYLLQKRLVDIDIQKINLDLYNKRFRIFELTKQILQNVSEKNEIDLIELRDFKFKTNERRFLFDEEIDKYILQIIKDANELTHSTKDLKDLNRFPVGSYEREEQMKKDDRLSKWFSDERDNVENRFLKYLDFRRLYLKYDEKS